MARRKGKKIKQVIRDDQFRDALITLGTKLKKNVFYIAVLTGAVVLFAYALYRRISHSRRTQEMIMRILTDPSSKLTSKRYRELLMDYQGSRIEPYLRLYLARALLEEHNRRCAESDDKSLLKEAEAQLQTILKRFPDAHTPVFYAGKLLPLVEKELKAEYRWVKAKKEKTEKGKGEQQKRE